MSPDDPMLQILGVGTTFEEEMEKLTASGSDNFFIVDSLEELAQKAHIPADALKSSVDEYNRFCEEGADPIFFKDAEKLKPIRGPRYYAAKFFCDTYGGLGGVAINHRAQVIDEDQNPIQGLFAAGNDANSIFGGTYPFYLCGNTSGFAYNTGRLAAQGAARYVGELNSR
jgi:fumarate reductase flavoprotein subunit